MFLSHYHVRPSHWSSNENEGMNQWKFKWRKCSSAIGCSNNWASRLHQPTFPFRPIRSRCWMESLENGNHNKCWKFENFRSQRIGWNKFRHGFWLVVISSIYFSSQLLTKMRRLKPSKKFLRYKRQRFSIKLDSQQFWNFLGRFPNGYSNAAFSLAHSLIWLAEVPLGNLC